MNEERDLSRGATNRTWRREFHARGATALAGPLLVLGALALSPAPPAWAAPGGEKTAGGSARALNVVLFLADDLGYGDVGVHGNRQVRTPNIDAFARESAELEQYRVSPVCSPTRASLLTGRYHFRGGVCDVSGQGCELDPAEVTVAEALRAAGYATAIFGKWHLGADAAHSPNAQGFDEALYVRGAGLPAGKYFDPTLIHNGVPEGRRGYCMDVFADAAVDFIRRNRARRFFLYLPANLIHTPLVVSEALSKPFLDAGASEATARVYGMIQSLDCAFGRVRTALRDAGVEDDTLLVFTSDNGPCSGSKPLDRHAAGLHGLKGTVYDNGIRVPCYVRWPQGFGSPAKVHRHAAHIDIMPTVLDACGVAAPGKARLDGWSLLPLLRAPGAAWEDRVLCFQWDSGQEPRRGSAYAVVAGCWKLVQPAGMDAPAQRHIRDRYAELCRLQRRGERSIEGTPRNELYAIADDPGETRDVAALHPDVVETMKRQYETWFDDTCSRWAPRVETIQALHDWTPDRGLAPLNQAARAVHASAADATRRARAAGELARLLDAARLVAVRRFACEQLAIVGDAAQVPVLARALADETLETPARGALERIGGAEAAAALRSAFRAAHSPARSASLLGSLARLRDVHAVPLAVSALDANDAALRQMAFVTLGRIGNAPAAAALLAREGKGTPHDRVPWGNALLSCADTLARTGEKDQAVPICDRLSSAGHPPTVRSAAFAARIRLGGDECASQVLEALRGTDAALRRGALDALADNRGARLRAWHRDLAPAFASLDPAARLQLLDLHVGADIREGASLAAGLIRDADPCTRRAGLRALGVLGSEPDTDLLLGHLTGDQPEDRAAAADALAALRSPSTDARLIALLPSAPAPTLVAAIDVLTRRGARPAIPALLDVASGADPDVARAAVRAVGELGSAAQIPALVEIVSRGGPATGNAATTIARLARAEPGPARPLLETAMRTASGPARDTLAKIHVLIDRPHTPGGTGASGIDLGPNLASGARAESPTGLNRDGAAQGPEAAVDGDPKTYWDEEDGRPEYRLRVVLEREVTVARLRLSGYRQHAFAPKDFSVLCDGREIRKVAGAEYVDNVLSVELPPTRCRTVEFVITKYHGGSPAIRELELFGPQAPAGAAKPAHPRAPTPAAARPAQPAGAGFTWEKSGGSIALLSGDRAVWRLHFAAAEPFPHFDPLCLAGGANLVWRSPADHVHHFAHWFAWKTINGVNYWEFDKTTGRPVGATRWSEVKADPRPDGSARVAMRLSYTPPDGPTVLREDRVLDISAPGPDGGYRIDWRMEWSAGTEPVTLDRTPPSGQPGGKPHGGYAGLSVRFAKGFTDWNVVDSKGAQGMDGHGKRAAASDFSGRIDGRECGIAILDHPKNPNAPTPWFYVINPAHPFGYTNPAYLFESAKRIESGGTLLLRYRVVVHAGRWDPATLERAVAAYAKEVP